MSEDDVSPRPRRIRAADSDRDAVLEVLGQAHAHGRLDNDEVDERQSAALAAKHLAELPELIADLPEGAELTARIEAQVDPQQRPHLPGPGTGSALAAQGPAGEIQRTAPGTGDVQRSMAILSGREITVPAGTPEVHVFALMGGDEIFLTDVLGPGVQVTVNAVSIMAGCEIYVPGGVRVIDETVNIMAGNDIHKAARGDGSNGTLILQGFSLMAGHDVRIDPGWSPAPLER